MPSWIDVLYEYLKLDSSVACVF